jgi:hypothetical protein
MPVDLVRTVCVREGTETLGSREGKVRSSFFKATLY